MKTVIYKQKKYCAILFHPSGDFVTDFESNSKAEIWDEINDMGSRWIFYPIPFITTGKMIVDTLPELAHLNRMSVKNLQKYLKNTWDRNSEEISYVINNGYPLDLIY